MLVITNRKPVHKLEHILSVDEDIIKEKERTYRNNHRHEEVDSDYLPTELDEQEDNIQFKENLSNASCKIDDI